MSRTTISIDTETRDRLREYGIKGDTWDSILNKLMDEHFNSMAVSTTVTDDHPLTKLIEQIIEHQRMKNKQRGIL